MRSIKIGGGNSVDVRGLSRKEVREYKALGVDFSSLPRETADEVMDDVNARVLSEEQLAMLDGMEYKHSLAVFRGVMAETFGAPDEEKNSSATLSGSATKTE